jgi:hypothetical protein
MPVFDGVLLLLIVIFTTEWLIWEEKNIYPRRKSKTLLFSHYSDWAIPAHFTNYSGNKLHHPPVIEMKQIHSDLFHILYFLFILVVEENYISQTCGPIVSTVIPRITEMKTTMSNNSWHATTDVHDQNLSPSSCVLHKFTWDRNSASAVNRLPLPARITIITKTI